MCTVDYDTLHMSNHEHTYLLLAYDDNEFHGLVTVVVSCMCCQQGGDNVNKLPKESTIPNNGNAWTCGPVLVDCGVVACLLLCWARWICIAVCRKSSAIEALKFSETTKQSTQH